MQADQEGGEDSFELRWRGKAVARDRASSPPQGSLLPCPGEGVDWEGTGNLLVEGDNLEVLKLLRADYASTVKLIYIDPPYNSGKTFIYDDNFRDGAGIRAGAARGAVPGPGEADRRHARWLGMMYPRLVLARELLRDDGAMFVSIDGSEFANLKLLMDEVFGEDNLLSVQHIQVRFGQKSLNARKPFQELVEYVLVYAKDRSAVRIERPAEAYSIAPFRFGIDHEAEPTGSFVLDGKRVEFWSAGKFSITAGEPSVERFKETWISGSILTGTGHGSVYTKYVDSRRAMDGDGCLYRIHGIGEDGLGYRYFANPRLPGASRGKMYTKVPLATLADLERGQARKRGTIVNYHDFSGDFGNIRHEGGIAFNAGKKPLRLIAQFLGYIDCRDGIVLDFFAGSGTTGHAVMAMNARDGGRRRFILVQLPEALDLEDRDQRAAALECLRLGKPLQIPELTKERLRRSGLALAQSHPDERLDLGFRVYRHVPGLA